MTNTPNADHNGDAQRPPVLPTILELDRVLAALSLLLPDFPIDRLTTITLDPNRVTLVWVPLGMAYDEPGARQQTTIPVANAATLAELNGKGPEL